MDCAESVRHSKRSQTERERDKTWRDSIVRFSLAFFIVRCFGLSGKTLLNKTGPLVDAISDGFDTRYRSEPSFITSFFHEG